MSRDEDDYEDDDRGHSHSGSYNHDHNSRQHSDKTSNFDTTLVSDDGKIFGIQLPRELASQLRVSYATVLDWARVKAEKFGIPFAENMAKNWGATEIDARRFGSKAGNVIGYGVIFGKQIYDVGDAVYDSTHKLNELRVAVKPLAKAGSNPGSTSPLSGDNEVVSNARGKINGLFWQRMGMIGSSLIMTIPALHSKWNEQASKNHERETLRRFEDAKGDPEKLAKVLEEEITLGGVAHGVDVKDINSAKDIMIEKQRKAYNEKFKKFATDNTNKVQKELKEIVDEISADNVNYQLTKLRRLGINTESLENDLRWSRQPNATEGDPVNKFKNFVQGIDSNNVKNRKKSRSVLDDALKAKFVRQEGAFDSEDLDFLHGRNSYGNDQPKTIKQQIEEKVEKLREAQQKVDQEEKAARAGQGKNEHGFDISKLAYGLGAGMVAEFVTKALGGKTLEKYKQPIALDRILHLRRELENAGDKPPERVPAMPKTNDKDVSYTQYVHNIFQQHQKDCNRAEIGDRFTEHFEKAHWDDEAVQKLPDDQLSAYEYAVKTIAQRIKNGRMDAIALIDLVGDKQKKIVGNDGRSFAGGGKDEAKIKEGIKRLLDEKTALLNSAQEQTDEQINSKLGDFVFSVDDLKKALDSNTLDQRQRAFIFTVFSDVVGSDEKLCQKIGIPADRCQQLRKECKESFGKMLDSAVIVLSEMVENEPEAVEKLKLTDKQKEMIASLAERVKAENKDVADLTKDREELKALETTVANAAMALSKEPGTPGEDGKPQNFWQRLVSATLRPKEKLEKEESSHPPHNGADKKSNGHMYDEENAAYSKGQDFSEKDDEEIDFGEEKSHRSKHAKKSSHKMPERKNFLEEQDDDKPVSMQDRVNKHRRNKPPHENRELV